MKLYLSKNSFGESHTRRITKGPKRTQCPLNATYILETPRYDFIGH